MLQVNDYQEEKDKFVEGRSMYTFNDTTPRGEKVMVVISEVHHDRKAQLPQLWKKKGCTKDLRTDYLSLDTYVYNTEGSCYRAYDPQMMKSWDGKRYVIDFDWLLPISEENRQKLLAEVVRRANNNVQPKTEKIINYLKSIHYGN